MNYKMRHTRQVVFLFIAVPLIILIMAVVFVALKQNMFEKRYYYYTALQDAIGISTQTPILYKGFEIGRIRDFNLTDNGEIRIQFYVLKSYNKIMMTDGVISRTNNPITGRTLLEYIDNPDSSTPLLDGGYIISTDFPEGKVLFRKISPRAGDAISSIVDNINSLTFELNRDNNPDKGSIFRILVNLADMSGKATENMRQIETVLNELLDFSVNLNRDHNADAGSIFRILNTVADITEVTKRQMVQIDSILVSVNRITRNYENPDSLIVRMIDPSGQNLVLPIRNTIISLDANLEETRKLLSTLNRNSPELLVLINNLNATLSQAQKTLEGINNNPLIRSGISPSQTTTNPTPGRIMELPKDE